VELLVELASLQTAFLTLDEAIKTTNRRVNALDNVVRPKLENTIAYIKAGCPHKHRMQLALFAVHHRTKFPFMSIPIICLKAGCSCLPSLDALPAPPTHRRRASLQMSHSHCPRLACLPTSIFCL
jgi:hypothetical protein